MGLDGGREVVYDVSHNIAKVEDHIVHGKSCKCCVHRKGATRALGGDHPELASRFSAVGQPVLVPGDMGTASWVLAGPKSGGNDAFSSSCHGAGRRLSRTAARKLIDSDPVSYPQSRPHETVQEPACLLRLEKKKKQPNIELRTDTLM